MNQGGVIKAFVNSCTHMGGPVQLDEKKQVFRCKWHEAEFDASSGEAIEGAAPKGTRLASISIVEEAGMLYGVLELPDDPFSF